MQKIHDIRVLRDFNDPIPVPMQALGISLCGRFKGAYEAHNAGLPPEDHLSMPEFLVTVLDGALPLWLEQQDRQQERAERGAGAPIKPDGRSLRTGDKRRKNTAVSEPIPHAAE